MKHSKASVDYGPGKPEHHCGPASDEDAHYCDHFIKSVPGRPHQKRCELVAGPIIPSYGCKLFERVKL
jgi:hypothetical protein